jgi:hypothetical protein
MILSMPVLPEESFFKIFLNCACEVSATDAAKLNARNLFIDWFY